MHCRHATRRNHCETEGGRARIAGTRLRRAAFFGSIARGQERPDSDIDILVEFEAGREGSLYECMSLKEYIAGLFDSPVDVIDRGALKPHLRAPVARDTMYAF
jgi:predicted nucleotidyltransferase